MIVDPYDDAFYTPTKVLGRYMNAEEANEERKKGTGWLQEELESLPSIVMGLMSYASLMSYEGAANALAHEGYRHFEAFD